MPGRDTRITIPVGAAPQGRGTEWPTRNVLPQPTGTRDVATEYRQYVNLQASAPRPMSLPPDYVNPFSNLRWNLPADDDPFRDMLFPESISRRELNYIYHVAFSSIDLNTTYSTLLNQYLRAWTRERFEEHWSIVYDMVTRNKAGTVKKETKKVPFLKNTLIKEFGRGRFTSVTTGEIGLEIEAEGRNLFSSPIRYWNAISDGSLREVDGHRPLEYVLRQPIPREEVVPALQYLTQRLKSHGSELIMSHRCSVHVHINVQKMEMLNLIKFMCLYFLFEDILVEWSGPDRKGNLFCLRAKDADFQVELLYNAIKKDEWSLLFEQEYRYAAMNMASMGNHGSLEFRSMKGNVDVDTISDWVKILLVLKDSSEEFKDPSTISRMYQSLGARQFLIKVFGKRIPEKIVETFLSYPIDQWMLESFQTAKDIFHCIDWNNPPKYMQGDDAPVKKTSSAPARRAHQVDREVIEYNDPEDEVEY